MIDIKLTEENIKELLDPVAVIAEFPNTPAYKLRVFPGELEDLGKPIKCNHVQVQFKNIKYEEYSQLKFGQRCIVQINKVNFNILVQNNNLRTHTDVYDIAGAVIQRLRGKCVLQPVAGNTVQGESPVQVTDYSFGKVKNGGACYQSNIDIMSCFTDTYMVQTKSV